MFTSPEKSAVRSARALSGALLAAAALVLTLAAPSAGANVDSAKRDRSATRSAPASEACAFANEATSRCALSKTWLFIVPVYGPAVHRQCGHGEPFPAHPGLDLGISSRTLRASAHSLYCDLPASG